MAEEKKEGTSKDLAELLGLPLRTVQRVAEKGVFVRLRRGIYDLPESIRSYYESQIPISGAVLAPAEVKDLPSLPCTTADLAFLFGFTSLRRVQQLVTDGVIVKSGKDFILGDAVRSYCDYLKGAGSQGSADLEAQRTRLVKAQADKQEIAVQLLLGDLLPAPAVLRAWSDLITVMKTRMLALPTKLSQRLVSVNDSAEIKSTLEIEVKAALEDLQNFDISECVEKSLPESFGDGDSSEDNDGQPVG